jgi:hypothetical protein
MTDPDPPPKGEYIPKELAQVRAIARLMDNAVPIPGTNFRVGLDAVLGLIPGVGDLLSGLIGSYILLTAARLGVPKVVLARMLLNVGADAALGVVPVAGDVLDAAWRTNAKNARLLERHLLDPRGTARGSWLTVIALAVVLFALLAGTIAVGVWLAGRLARLLG